MPVEMFPVETGRSQYPGRFLLRPSIGVVAWAEARPASDATVAWAPLADLAEQVLSYLELGFAPSIANTPALAKYEQPPHDRFTASRLVAGLHLANERLSREWSARNVVTSAAALHFDGSQVTLVEAGSSIDIWHMHEGTFRRLRSRLRPIDERGREAAFVPTREDLVLEHGDVLGVGLMPNADVARIASCAAAVRIDELLTMLIADAETNGSSGVVCRWRM